MPFQSSEPEGAVSSTSITAEELAEVSLAPAVISIPLVYTRRTFVGAMNRIPPEVMSIVPFGAPIKLIEEPEMVVVPFIEPMLNEAVPESFDPTEAISEIDFALAVSVEVEPFKLMFVGDNAVVLRYKEGPANTAAGPGVLNKIGP